MPRKPKTDQEPQERTQDEGVPAGPLTWDELRACIGPGGIVSFQVSAEGYAAHTHANRRKYHPRIVASLLRSCDTEEDVADVLADNNYPPGSYLLTARTGPGPRDWWKPHGVTVSIGVTVGDGGLQEIDETDEDTADVDTRSAPHDPVSDSLLNQIRQNDLIRQLRTSEAALDDVESRARSRERRDALDIVRELRENDSGRGNAADLVAALAPLALPFLERLARPDQDLSAKAAEQVIQMTTTAARTQADIASSVMRDMLQTQMDMMLQLQRDKMGLGEEPDPIKALIPAALQAVLPALAASQAQASAPPQPQPAAHPQHHPTPPASNAGSVTPQGLAVSFVRTVIRISYVRPAADVIYEKSIREAFGLLPEGVRDQLLLRLQDETKNPFIAFTEFAAEIDPAVIGDLQALIQDEAAALYVVKLLGFIADDFIESEKEDEGSEGEHKEQPAEATRG